MDKLTDKFRRMGFLSKEGAETFGAPAPGFLRTLTVAWDNVVITWRKLW